MLRRLALEEFVIVERAEAEFAPGLNALTGETGAGKSILIDALGLLAGGRASSEWVRRDALRLAVEGEIDLGTSGEACAAAAAMGIPLEDGRTLLVRREVSADGRSRCFAGGRQVLVSQLRELTAGVLWIVGQGEQRALTDPAEQEWILDRFAQAEESGRRYREVRSRFLAAVEAGQSLAAEQEAFSRDREWLEAQAREIRAAEVTPGERARLRALADRLRGRTAEAALCEEIEGRLFREEGSILDHLESLLHRLHGREAEPWPEVRTALSAMRDAARELRHRLPSAEAEPEADPNALEERLRQIERLCRRYAEAEDDEAESAVLQRLQELEEKLAAGAELDRRIEAAATARTALAAELAQAGETLSRVRAAGAARFAERIAAEFGPLGMKGAALRFVLEPEPDPAGIAVAGAPTPLRPLESGLERVRLHFRPHPTEAEGELSRVASGGELSRILLAIHAALGEASPPGCWVLDEVDAGIGGEAANRVAEMLAGMARHAQVLLVTHLPAIAARAERQVRVRKSETAGRPQASLTAVAGEERVAELARMLSGEAASATARQHARELLAAAEAGKPRPASGRTTTRTGPRG